MLQVATPASCAGRNIGPVTHCGSDLGLARVSAERPFFHSLHAGAYDALITDPVEPWVQAVHEHLEGADLEQASILDAGDVAPAGTRRG